MGKKFQHKRRQDDFDSNLNSPSQENKIKKNDLSFLEVDDAKLGLTPDP